MELSRRLEEAERQLALQDAALAEVRAHAQAADQQIFVSAERFAEVSNLLEPPNKPALPTYFVRM